MNTKNGVWEVRQLGAVSEEEMCAVLRARDGYYEEWEWGPCDVCGRFTRGEMCGTCYEEYEADAMRGMVQGEDW